MAKIVRPVRGRLRVWLPYQPGSGNKDLLKGLCETPTSTRAISVVYNHELKCFEVARAYLGALIAHLPSALGQSVDVVLEGASQTRCVEACWNASPDSKWECVCSCAGRFHGTRTGPPRDLGGGLAVQTDYTSHTYTVWP